MSNSYLDEWEKVRNLANSVKQTQQKLKELEIEYQQVQSALASLSPSYDEDGNDVNENKRNYYESVASGISKKFSNEEYRLYSLSESARSMAASYLNQAEKMRGKINPHRNAQTSFNQVAGFRFGSAGQSAARTAGAYANHYEDQAAELNRLAEAAEAAANGAVYGGPGNIRDKQGNSVAFRANGGGAGFAGAGKNAPHTGASGRNPAKENTSEGVSDAELVANSMGSVRTNAGKTNLFAFADAQFAIMLGTTADEVRKMREDNKLSWTTDSQGNAQLVPLSMAERNKGATDKQEAKPACDASAKDTLTAYMWAHNWGPEDQRIYEQDPEWQRLHKAVYPDYKTSNEKIAAARIEKNKQYFEQYHIDYEEMSGFVASNLYDNGRYFVASGTHQQDFRYFDQHWYSDYQRDESFKSYVETIKSCDIEGVEISRDDIKNPKGFWGMHDSSRTMESYVDTARKIPLVQKRLANGESLDSIEQDTNLKLCVDSYFRNPIRVSIAEGENYYIFNSDGRHRVLAAMSLNMDIPVTISSRYKKK